MVYLKKLEMRNFKSFGARRVMIDLDTGFTVVTGPNGSGKSNIIDAVRFVLGDLSARSLRADRMSGVIFDGGKKASLIANVKLYLDNCDRRLPIDLDTVMIARKVDRGGTSEYLLNGRRVSRGQLVDILRMAGLSSSGYNMIMQGTITRLADLTPEERRKAIEDLTGIAEYDAKKAEARSQLQQAEVNLRIASVRIGDVQTRLERLEEERNDALRYNFIQAERKKLQAALISYKLLYLDAEKISLTNKLRQKSNEAALLKNQYDQLLDERNSIEAQRRRFDEEIVDKGNVKLVSIQEAIGDLLANISSFRMEIDSGNTSLKGLQKIQEDRKQQLEVLKRQIHESRKTLQKQKRERSKIENILKEKNEVYSSTSFRLAEAKEKFEKNSAELKKIESEFNDVQSQISKLNTKLRGNSVRQKILEDHLDTLKERSENFELTFKDLQQHFTELQKLQKNEQKSLNQLSQVIDKNISREKNLLSELEDGEKTVKIASNSVIEFEAQKGLAERLATEESSLQRIEEMGEVGAIPGIFGRVETLIKTTPRFQKAIKAASAGWLKSVVVKDLETALRCVESLKKMKLGQLRFIPLKEVGDVDIVKVPEIEGVIGVASSLLRCDQKIVPAINFIFGDTIVTSGEKSAFLVSRAGYRAVGLNGDIYETRGGLMGGYYREPIDFASLIPSDKAIKGLSKSVKSLGDLLEKRRTEISLIDEDVAQLKEERIRRSEVVNSIERELKVIKLNLTRARQNAVALNKRVERTSRRCEKEMIQQKKDKSEEENYQKKFSELSSKRLSLKSKTRPNTVEKLGTRCAQQNLEINDLEVQITKVGSDISFIESNLQNILLPEFKTIKINVKTITDQISGFRDRVTKAKQSLDEAEKQISKFQKSKEVLSTNLFSVKGKRREFEKTLDEIDEKIRGVDRDYISLNNEIHALEMEIQRTDIEVRRLEEELINLGCEGRLNVDEEGVKRAENSINLMILELERLGSVNQLAIAQYGKQKESYKQLSIRQNELEKERRAIIEFMDEIERKKREAFLQAFNDMNENFGKFFSKLTGGGVGYFSLQNLENPFAGGVDIFVQFPGKASRLIAGASGGEKSVTAVAFIFSIQNLFPAPFYLFDEIDAHLDPYNAERLADLLKERAIDSQIIAMTLRDVIMDRADRLFGVYIQNGVSRLVSAKIVEAPA